MSRTLHMPRLALALGLGLIAAGPVVSQRADADAVSRLQSEHRDEQLRARRLRADAAEAEAELARLERELARLNVLARDEDGALAAQRARLKTLGEREARLAAELSGERAGLGRLLSALQMMSRKPPPPLLISADQATDTVRAAILMQAITPSLQQRARALGDRQAEIGRLRRLAALSSEQLFTAESAQLDRRGEIETLSAQRASARSVLRAEAARAERAAATLEARIRELGGTARALSARDAAPTSQALPGGRTRLASPLNGAPAASGPRGLTWAGEARQAVVAPAAATVAYAGPLDGWGEVVILDLSQGWRMVLAGLGHVSVAEGQAVGEGAPIGALPDQLDPDLYLEVRREDQAVAARRWFD